MTVEQMRFYISECSKYNKSASWREKCRKMSDAQVTAIYLKFQKEGLIK